MSGGHFDYAYFQVVTFSEQLKNELDKQPKDHEYYEFSPEVVTRLQQIQKITEVVAGLMKEAEWLYSADTSEKTFLERTNGLKNIPSML